MNIVLLIHILAGVGALISAAIAISARKGRRVHSLSGLTYFWCMALIFVTALIMAIAKGNIFLLLIGVFSFYMAFAGMRFAHNRTGIAHTVDWLAIGLLILSGVGMLLLAGFFFIHNDSQYVTLTVFGGIALGLGWSDFKSYRGGTARGKARIAKHIVNMLGGTIAVITAALVVNVNSEPVWLWWILPSLLIVPLIIWWQRKVLRKPIAAKPLKSASVGRI